MKVSVVMEVLREEGVGVHVRVLCAGVGVSGDGVVCLW